MIGRFARYLGPVRVQALFYLLAGTGLISLILNAFEEDWVPQVQTLLVLIFFVGAAIIIFPRLEREERGRWLAILLPAIGALIIGMLFLPEYQAIFAGGALGWIIAGLIIFRPRGKMEYQKAVKHLRKNEFADAVRIMDDVIKAEPNEGQHYRFRAEILRVWGKLDRARRDYEQMVKLEPDSAVAYNGLAEVNLQSGRYDAAREAALKAYALAPGEWVAAYNLGMIEDRLGLSNEAIEHLQQALRLRVPEKRHRLLVRLYLARAYARLGDLESARREVAALKAERGALKEWNTLLGSDQAATLRAALGDDIRTAQALAQDEMTVEQLASGAPA